MILTQTNFENTVLEALTNNFYKNYKQVASVEKTNFPLSQSYSSYWLYLTVTIQPHSKHFCQHLSMQKIALGVKD